MTDRDVELPHKQRPGLTHLGLFFAGCLYVLSTLELAEGWRVRSAGAAGEKLHSPNMMRRQRPCIALVLDQKKKNADGSLTVTDIGKALFSSKIFCKIGIVALSFVFDKYCLIID